MKRTTTIFAWMLASNAAVAAAQGVEGPPAGTWGAETGAGAGVSVLRFQSRTLAMMIGATALYTKQTPPPGPSTTILDSEVRFGLRRYGRPEQRVRPFWTVAAIVGYDENPLVKNWNFGGAADGGAAYFFSRHVSLGASADLSVVRQTNARVDPLRGETVEFPVILGRFGLRLLGAVYF